MNNEDLKINLERLVTDEELLKNIFLPQPNKDYIFEFVNDGRRDVNIRLNLTAVLVLQDMKSSNLRDKEWLKFINNRLIELEESKATCKNKKELQQIINGIEELDKFFKMMVNNLGSK